MREFLRAQNVSPRQIEVACFGVAGAVTENVARLSNVPWLVDVRTVSERSGLARCVLLNDLEALGYAIPVLRPDELAVLQQGVAAPNGNAAVIAAGTGLGEALLHNLDGRFVPAASEGGHANFAPHDHRQVRMAEAMFKVFDHVSVEHVLSGPGLVNIYQFTHEAFGSAPSFTPSPVTPHKLCSGVGQVRDPSDLPAMISQAALSRRCPQCVEALDIFVTVYGSEAGNLALRYVATGGVYVGGGIAPKILPAHGERHVPRRLPRQGGDEGSRRHHPGLGHPQSRRRADRRSGARSRHARRGVAAGTIPQTAQITSLALCPERYNRES